MLTDTTCGFDIHSDFGAWEGAVVMLVFSTFLVGARVVPIIENKKDHSVFMHSQHTVLDLSYPTDCT